MSELDNKKHERFCNEFVKSLNATASYKLAFEDCKSDNTARTNSSKLLAKADITERIQQLMNDRSERTKIDADDVLLSIHDIRERCLEAVEAKDRQGKPLGHYKFDASNALKANELLGKHLKLFTDKVEHSGEVENKVTIIPIDLEERVKQLKDKS